MNDKEILTQRFEIDKRSRQSHIRDLTVKLTEEKKALVRLCNEYYLNIGIKPYDRVLIKHKCVNMHDSFDKYEGVFIGCRIVGDNVFPLVDLACKNSFEHLCSIDGFFEVSDLYQMEKVD